MPPAGDLTNAGSQIPGWHQFLIGKDEGIFLVEVLYRTVVICFLVWFAMRVMGKRLSGQLSISELAIVLTLGAVAGLPLQDPERGILPAVVVLAVASPSSGGSATAGSRAAAWKSLRTMT